MNFMRKLIVSAILIILLSIVFLLGWIARGIRLNHQKASPKVHEIRQGGYSLINPLLECEIAGDAIGDREVIPSKRGIEDLVKAKTKKYKLAHVSVYFRDLNDGPSFGINEDEKFAPASLLKLPLMISLLKQAENDPHLLSRRIAYKKSDEDYNKALTFMPSKMIVPGHSYSIDELIYAMIVYSDNNANTLLFKNTDPKKLIKTYIDLGVQPPIVGRKDDYMSVEEYTSFFRILFNSSYLGKEMSERALRYLTEAEFKDGIVAGVPSGIVVAHKFGERVSGAQNEIKELHDCGIVYYPNSPYLLCIMTRGTDFSTLDDIIRDISHRVYEELDFRYRQNRKG